MTRILQITVPSSGTRFVRDSFKEAGWNTLTTHSLGAVEELNRKGANFVWGHYSHTPAGILTQMQELCDYTMITVRDPIKVWASNYVDWRDTRPASSRDKMALSHQMQLGPCWLYQNEIEYDYCHRVDMDPIEWLGGWASTNLVPGPRHASPPSRMKQAVEERDIDKIEWLCEGTQYWNWFKNEATPVFEELYTELCYDLWWTK
jgi:hypothetical protein